MAGLMCYLNGEYILQSEAKISVDDRAFLFGDGLYEVSKTVGGHICWEAEHMLRLERGIRELKMDNARSVVKELPAISRKLLALNGLADKDATIYVQVSRGAAPRYHAFPAPETPPTVYVFAKPMAPLPPSAFADGVSATTMQDIRWGRCDLKTTCLLPNCMAKQKAKEHGAYECLLVRDGPDGDKLIVEASHSNAFVVLGGELWTTPLSQNILPGITRNVIVARAASLGIKVHEEAAPMSRWSEITEVFTTSTGPDVAPIVKVDDRVVGDGKVGPVTKALLAAFAGAWLEDDKATTAARMAAAGYPLEAPAGAAGGAGATA